MTPDPKQMRESLQRILDGYFEWERSYKGDGASAMANAYRQNEKSRARAAKADKATYLHDVVETWSACTLCGVPIRSRITGRFRFCGCPGVRWDWPFTPGVTSEWVRVEDDAG